MARIAFCQDVLVEYMSFMCMSAVLKAAGHEVRVFVDEGVDTHRFARRLAEYDPDLVGFSLLTPSVPWALEVARQVKAGTRALTVVGNVHVMMTPGIVEEDGIDIACIGEGEGCLLELCEALDESRDYSRIPGLWVKTADGVVRNPKRTQLVDMETAPVIDRELYNDHFFFRNSPYLRVMLGRGCPFRCSFCSNTPMTDHFGGAQAYVRKRSPQKAIEEVEQLIRQHPRRVKHVFIIDEVLWVKNDWLREFLALWKERISLPFTASFRFGGITEDDIRMLAEAKAGPLAVATETADEDTRRGLLNKPVKNDHVLKVGGWMHKYGVEFGSSQFFGLPGATADEYRGYLKFFRELRPRYLWTTFFQPYPGLPLTQQEGIREHLPAAGEFSKTFHHDMYLDLPDRHRLVNLKKVYYLMMRFPALEGPLFWLTRFRIPLLFDVLFLAHFSFYIFWWERVSPVQWLYHLRLMALNPLLRRKQPLQGSGRPFTPRPAADRRDVRLPRRVPSLTSVERETAS